MILPIEHRQQKRELWRKKQTNNPQCHISSYVTTSRCNKQYLTRSLMLVHRFTTHQPLVTPNPGVSFFPTLLFSHLLNISSDSFFASNLIASGQVSQCFRSRCPNRRSEYLTPRIFFGSSPVNHNVDSTFMLMFLDSPKSRLHALFTKQASHHP